MFVYIVPVGDSLEEAILEGIKLAKEEQETVKLWFNGCDIQCHPKSTMKTVLQNCLQHIPVEIVVTTLYNGDFQACLRDRARTSECGKSVPEAIGKVVLNHAHKMHIEII